MKEKVSIIIPCRNEEKFIEKCINSILKQDYKGKIEVLVIDGMSEDKTREIIKKIAEKHRNIKLIDNHKKITPVALNLGIEKARGEIIMRVDAHYFLDKNYIRECIETLEKHEADVVGGVWKILPRENTLIGKSIALVLSNKFGAGFAYYKIGEKRIREVDTVFFCCKKEIFEKAGKFNENLKRGQDMEWNLRLRRKGGKILLNSKIKGYYYVRSEFKEFCGHNFINGMWAILPFKYAKIPVSFRHLVPFFFVSFLILSFLLSFFSFWFFYLFLTVLILYLISNLIYSFFISTRERDIRLFFILPFIFISLHFGYGFGSLVGLIKLIF